jgi:hypothetical protein
MPSARRRRPHPTESLAGSCPASFVPLASVSALAVFGSFPCLSYHPCLPSPDSLLAIMARANPQSASETRSKKLPEHTRKNGEEVRAPEGDPRPADIGQEEVNDRSRRSSLPSDVPGLLVIAQAHELRVPEVAITRPFRSVSSIHRLRSESKVAATSTRRQLLEAEGAECLMSRPRASRVTSARLRA